MKSASVEDESPLSASFPIKPNQVPARPELNDLPKLLIIQFSYIQLSMEGLGAPRAVAVPHPLPQLP